jgi:uncharacterized protein YdeI (YjbR/CyaY-like superfamily)
MQAMPKPIFFASPAEFRSWLEKHHAGASELWVGFYKKHSGKPSLTWPESVDCALCFGWIDGIRKSLGETSYSIRFTPRKPASNWSAINIKRVAELEKMGLMWPSGREAFQQRKDAKSGVYSYEQRKTAKLSATQEKEFRSEKPAWEYFRAQPPWYRRIAAFWVSSAKKEETRQRRFAALIESSRHQRRIGPVAGKK